MRGAAAALAFLAGLLIAATAAAADEPECRGSGVPVADRPWIKIANFEWAEPNHNPRVEPDSPGYWQPDWLADEYVEWEAPRHILREGTPTETRWRDREVAYYRVTREPAWEHGAVIVDAGLGSVVNDPPGEPVRATVDLHQAVDTTHEHEGRTYRLDGVWTYTLRDRQQTGSAYTYTIEASTCEGGPWGQTLELQYNVVGAPDLTHARLSRVGDNGESLPDDQIALVLWWGFERGDIYRAEVRVLRPNGLLYFSTTRAWRHLGLPGAGGSDRIVLTDFLGQSFAGLSAEVRIQAAYEYLPTLFEQGPWSPPETVTVPVGGL